LNENEKLISKYLGDTCNVLSVECPDNATQSIQNIQQQIKTIISKLSDSGKGFIGNTIKPLLDQKDFNEEMLNVLNILNEEFSQHYSLRKNVLRKRMEVTIESMLESDRAKQQKAEILKGLNQRLSALDTQSGDLLDLEEDEFDDQQEEDEKNENEENDENEKDESMEQRSSTLPLWIIFSAQKDIFRNDTITMITSDVESEVRKVTIPPVPDRGGRASEVRQIEIDNIPFSQFGGRGKRGRGRRGRGFRGQRDRGRRGGQYGGYQRGRGQRGYDSYNQRQRRW